MGLKLSILQIHDIQPNHILRNPKRVDCAIHVLLVVRAVRAATGDPVRESLHFRRGLLHLFEHVNFSE